MSAGQFLATCGNLDVEKLTAFLALSPGERDAVLELLLRRKAVDAFKAEPLDYRTTRIKLKRDMSTDPGTKVMLQYLLDLL